MANQDIMLRTQWSAPAIPSHKHSAILTPSKFGWLVIVTFFGLIGLWVGAAPLYGAVIGEGFVKVSGNRKTLQHLEGGIIKQLRVKEGDRVKSGETLILLDDTQARTEYEVLSEQLIVQRATEERLKAELAGTTDLRLPDDLRDMPERASVLNVWNGQLRQYEARLKSLLGQRTLIEEKIAQLRHQIAGTEAQSRAYQTQLQSVRSEISALAPLVEKGIVTRPRILQLERSAAALEGQSAEADATVSRTRQAIAEQSQQILQIDNDRKAEIAKELRDAQAHLLEIIPKLMNARARLGRMEIRSPYDGKVVGLSIFSVGGVVQPGEKLLDVVPDREDLVIEARIGAEDIPEIRPGMQAHVQLPSYRQRTTPSVPAQVLQVSADRLTDPRTGGSYFLAEIAMDQSKLDLMPNVKLYPGMPATVLVPTVQRTALDYLIGPFFAAFDRSFRER